MSNTRQLKEHKTKTNEQKPVKTQGTLLRKKAEDRVWSVAGLACHNGPAEGQPPGAVQAS